MGSAAATASGGGRSCRPLMTALQTFVAEDHMSHPRILKRRTPDGLQKVRCGPATQLQPRLPSHGLHCLFSSIVRSRLSPSPVH